MGGSEGRQEEKTERCLLNTIKLIPPTQNSLKENVRVSVMILINCFIDSLRVHYVKSQINKDAEERTKENSVENERQSGGS